MAYTSHGHHIPGTRLEKDPPPNLLNCGGLGFCGWCSTEATAYREGMQDAPEPEIEQVNELRAQLLELLDLVDEQIAIIKDEAVNMKLDNYLQMRDMSGNWIMIGLITTKAQLISSLIALRPKE